MHGLKNLRRHRRCKVLLRGRGVIANRVPVAGLILHLHHNYGALWIDFLQVSEQSGKGALVGIERSGREG